MKSLSTEKNQAAISKIVGDWNELPRQIRGNSSPYAIMEERGGEWLFVIKGDMVEWNGSPFKKVNLWRHECA
jgi:hypothetical protein